jgi:hypothetical protein|tara:strand:- start:421 stop:555 length:135 start_codon:yes stop_codon:yes gene_type:complete
MTCLIGLEIPELTEKDMSIGKKKTPDYYFLRIKIDSKLFASSEV